MDMLLLDAPTCTQILDADMDMGSFSAADAVIQSLDAANGASYEDSLLQFADNDNLILQLRKRSPVRHQCNLCDKSFTGKVYLNLHKKIHTGDCKMRDIEPTNVAIFAPTEKNVKKKGYKCSKCDSICSSPYHLSVHLRSHEDKPVKKYVCLVCKRAYAAPQYLQSHMFSHSNESPYNCDICNKSFTGKSYLQLHMRLHMNGNKYKCELCDNTFVSLAYLTLHMSKHRKLKKFKCKICDRQFMTKSKIETHRKSCDINEKSTCTICYRKVPLNLLTKHCTKNHKASGNVERPHKCKECDKSFILMLNLDLHLKLDHGIERNNVFDYENEKEHL